MTLNVPSLCQILSWTKGRDSGDWIGMNRVVFRDSQGNGYMFKRLDDLGTRWYKYTATCYRAIPKLQSATNEDTTLGDTSDTRGIFIHVCTHRPLTDIHKSKACQGIYIRDTSGIQAPIREPLEWMLPWQRAGIPCARNIPRIPCGNVWRAVPVTKQIVYTYVYIYVCVHIY